MTTIDDVIFQAARSYIRVVGLVKDACGRNLPGLGWAARRVHSPRVLRVHGRQMAFDPAVAGAYGRLLAGQWNEPETHLFLNRVADDVEELTFVDVGASVGAMVIDLASHPHVRAILAFEPHPPSAAVCRRNAMLNGWNRIDVREVALGADRRRRSFLVNARRPTESHFAAGKGIDIEVSTLDQETSSIDGPCLILIDVEGAEADVMAGGRDLISRTRPVIVFEYNAVSRRHFDLQRIREILGPGFAIWRLRIDGMLDRRYEDAWNCVAIPLHGPLAKAASKFVVAE